MPNDNQAGSLNRRLLLMSAWTAPVVASFALGGMAVAGSILGNASLSGGALVSRNPNGTLLGPAVKTPVKPK